MNKAFVTCDDFQQLWNGVCPYCKDKSQSVFTTTITKIKKPEKQTKILINKQESQPKRKIKNLTKPCFRVYNVFENAGRILGKKGKCVYCNEFADTKDHFYPTSKGGILTVHCCYDCNQQKADLTPTQWIMYIEYVYDANEEKKVFMINNVKKLIRITKGYPEF